MISNFLYDTSPDSKNESNDTQNLIKKIISKKEIETENIIKKIEYEIQNYIDCISYI